MRKMIFLATAFVVAIMSVSAQEADAKYANLMLPVGTQAPELNADVADAPSMESLRGRYVVLDFWASWCPDCRKDMPTMKSLYETYGKRDVEFIGISFDTNPDAMQKYMKDNNICWRQVCSFKKWKENKLSDVYHIKWLPSVYLLDKEGKIILATVEIEKLVEKLAELHTK